ncbi:hypothetical protein JDV02_000042 [Purpureocillium takamizusanense]|uniref:Uncharacterized protein n=1 Tax=Purpureocillium takamizusanense TaxID=2060973 RepID=A0A9Q8Q5C1_9HYPO|nr:uncharacterized protein JDV02_000042 [Purpureocillium takamizusanense]UNI13285.1 hypothetical protein JDV02_000042 [Purpureocillium takamizusanense]
MSHVQLRLEDEGAPDFAGDVVETLNAVLAPNRSKSPSEAAASLNALCSNDYAQHGSAGSFLWWFWDLVHDLARQLPYDGPQQDQLADVVRALHDLPPRTVSLGEDWGSEGDVQLWTGLPMFANTFREKLDDGDSRASGEVQRKERAVNLQAYASRVAGMGFFPFEMYAVWAFVDALEGTMRHVRGAPDEVDDDPASIEGLPYKVSIAASWMVHTGERLYGRDEEVHGATAGPLWRLDKKEAIRLRRKFRGTNGLCPQRWRLWKGRFAAIHSMERLDEKVRTEAKNACAAMDKAEESHKS